MGGCISEIYGSEAPKLPLLPRVLPAAAREGAASSCSAIQIGVHLTCLSGQELIKVDAEPSWSLFRLRQEVQKAVKTGVVAWFVLGDNYDSNLSFSSTVGELELKSGDALTAVIATLEEEVVGTHGWYQKLSYEWNASTEKLLPQGNGICTIHCRVNEQQGMDNAEVFFKKSSRKSMKVKKAVRDII